MKRLIRFFTWWGLRLDSDKIPAAYRHRPARITALTAWALSK